MRTKTLIELLTLSTNLYMISKDEEFMKNLSEMFEKGSRKAGQLVDNFTDEEGENEDQLMQKLLNKVKKAKAELEVKIEETALKVYEKMHIAHADDLKRLRDELEKVKGDLALAEVRLEKLRSSNSDAP